MWKLTWFELLAIALLLCAVGLFFLAWGAFVLGDHGWSALGFVVGIGMMILVARILVVGKRVEREEFHVYDTE